MQRPNPRADDLLATQSRLNKVSKDFLKIDLETALVFTLMSIEKVGDIFGDMDHR